VVTHSLQAFSNGIFHILVTAVDKILTDNASRGPAAIAELLFMT